MYHVDATYCQLLFDHVDHCGLDAQALLGTVPDASSRVSATRWQKLLSKAAGELDQPAFGLSVANRFSLKYLGALGYLLRTSDTVMEALTKAQRYHLLISEMNPLKVAIEGENIILSWPQIHGGCGQLWDEMGLGTVSRLINLLAQQSLPPSRVDFICAEPDELQLYQAFFGCEVRFGQAMPRMAYPIHYLAYPMPDPDPCLHELLDQQVRARFHTISQTDNQIAQYRKQVARMISHGSPTLENLACENRISVRSMQRRLEKNNISFQSLLDETRLTLAEHYLRDPRLSLSDVTGLVGYTEQSSFSRAFIRWRGVSPGRWRQQATTSAQIPIDTEALG